MAAQNNMAQNRRNGAEGSWPQLATNERQAKDKMTRWNFVAALNAHRRKGCKEVSKTINRRKEMPWSSFFSKSFPIYKAFGAFSLGLPFNFHKRNWQCCCSYKLQGLVASLLIHPVYPSLPIHPVYPSLPIHRVYPSLPINPVYPSLTIHPVYPSLPILLVLSLIHIWRCRRWP